MMYDMVSKKMGLRTEHGHAVKLPLWTCLCGKVCYWPYKETCPDCGNPRYYQATQAEAYAIGGELNRREHKNASLRCQLAELQEQYRDVCRCLDKAQGMLEAKRIAARYLFGKQRCGHERRFIVSGDDKDIDPKGKSDMGKTGWCALCGLESVRAHLREHHAAERWAEEATDETD